MHQGAQEFGTFKSATEAACDRDHHQGRKCKASSSTWLTPCSRKRAAATVAVQRVRTSVATSSTGPAGMAASPAQRMADSRCATTGVDAASSGAGPPVQLKPSCNNKRPFWAMCEAKRRLPAMSGAGSGTTHTGRAGQVLAQRPSMATAPASNSSGTSPGAAWRKACNSATSPDRRQKPRHAQGQSPESRLCAPHRRASVCAVRCPRPCRAKSHGRRSACLARVPNPETAIARCTPSSARKVRAMGRPKRFANTPSGSPGHARTGA